MNAPARPCCAVPGLERRFDAAPEGPVPETMARAIRLGTEAGRLAYRAGRIPRRLYATASTPEAGTPSF